LIGGCAAVVAALVIGIGLATNHTSTTNGTALDGAPATAPSTNQLPSGNSGTFGTPNTGDGSGTGSGSGTGTGTGTTASAKQQVGVVDIDTVVDYNQGEAAGTGLVLDSSGDILTNNHVIDGATSIKVTIVSTGKTYTATVVGTSPTQDIAVIKLVGASGLSTANFGNSSSVKVGDSVTGVGNAGGVGGVPSAAVGTVTALNQTITASDESGQNSEQLTGVIATNAPIKAGDSGGPLYSSSNKVIGIDTAANTTRQQSAGFAIPINHARDVAQQIEAGVETSSIHIGSPAALGVAVEAATSGVLLQQVYPGEAAARAGMVVGDVVTAVNGTQVTTLTQLKSLISAHDPGAKLSVTYTDQSGTSHTVTVTLGDGPAD
jgi:S1-C subfamily serine protease